MSVYRYYHTAFKFADAFFYGCLWCMVFTNEGKVFLIKRTKNKKDVYWVVPGGGIEDGEDNETALRREMLEELGISIKDISLFHEDAETNQVFFICKEDKSVERVERSGPELEQETPDNLYENFEVEVKDVKSLRLFPEYIKDKFLSHYNK
jgi:8-oxo-dGTP pyrophosphatase MutT (NUDIX family)